MCFPYVQILKYDNTFLFSIFILGNSASHFLEMIMLISWKGMLSQTRIGRRGVIFPRMGPIGDQYVFLMSKSKFVLYIFY